MLFFCDPIEVPWGQSMEDQTSASVMFFSEQKEPLGRRNFPAELSNPRSRLLRPEEFVSRPRRLTPKPWLLPPPFCSGELTPMIRLLRVAADFFDSAAALLTPPVA